MHPARDAAHGMGACVVISAVTAQSYPIDVNHKNEVIMEGIMKCAIYTRVSTDNQAEVQFNSCEAQEAKIRSFIDSQENMEVYKVYTDPGFTGANLDRPALCQMLEDMQTGEINLVIAYKIDRLTRTPKDFYNLMVNENILRNH